MNTMVVTNTNHFMQDKEPVNEQGHAHGEHFYYFFSSGELMARH